MTGQAQEPFFCTDSAVVRGRIVDYSPAMGFQNLTVQVTDIFTGELKTATAEIREDGTFEKRLLLHHPILNWFYTSEIHISKHSMSCLPHSTLRKAMMRGGIHNISLE